MNRLTIDVELTPASLADAIATLQVVAKGLGVTEERSQVAPTTAPEPEPNPFAEGAVKPTPPPPATETAPAASGSELDKRGMPWDARIHASTKSKLANGNWKNKRGVPDAEREAIEAELLGGAPDSGADNTTTPPPPPVQEAAAQTPPPPVAQASGEKVETFPQLMHFIQSNGITPDVYRDYLTAFGLTALPDLLQPDNAGVIPQLHAALAQLPQASA